MNQIIECIPNFSEGRNQVKIREITGAIESVSGVKLLDVSSGKATNRTVVTFAGDPDSVVEAAFRGIQKAAQVLDMRKHTGVHPRFGATDVCPLVPVANISMEETVKYARQLAERVGNELLIPVYCYEHAAFTEERRSLANCRWGGYEGLKYRLDSENWKPDFCRNPWSDNVARTGAVAIGARNFLVAFNINLNTTSVPIANSIALDVRESGRAKRNDKTGEPFTGTGGEPLRIPGTLKKTRAIGWFIDEFGIAQVSMNLLDLSVTPVHAAFDEVTLKAAERGVRVTGSELVGLIPLQSLLDAGNYFLRKQKRSTGVSDDELIKIAVRSLGLDDLQPFDPRKKVIEFLLDDEAGSRHIDKPVAKFVNDTASESLGPGGGAVSAAVGAMGAALAGMVANLSAQKEGWQHRWEEFSNRAEEGKLYHQALLGCVDEDSKAFTLLYNALKLPAGNEEETARRNEVVLEASKNAMQVPLTIMKYARQSMNVLKEMALNGNPNTISDTGTGAYCAMAAVESAYLSVKINSVHCTDKQFAGEALNEAEEIVNAAGILKSEILKITGDKINDLK
jgi:glutamate formiminotransferase / formiminotetrahydrofolate cyclodeaminase